MTNQQKRSKVEPRLERRKNINSKGGDEDVQGPVFYEMEFDGPVAMEGFFKSGDTPEMMALMPKFDAVIESHEHDVFVEAPIP